VSELSKPSQVSSSVCVRVCVRVNLFVVTIGWNTERGFQVRDVPRRKPSQQARERGGAGAPVENRGVGRCKTQ
jgi:hypothetical protein